MATPLGHFAKSNLVFYCPITASGEKGNSFEPNGFNQYVQFRDAKKGGTIALLSNIRTN